MFLCPNTTFNKVNLICIFKSLGFCLFVYKEKQVHLTKFSKWKWYILKTVFFINDIPYLPSIWSFVPGVALGIKEQIYIFSIRRLYVCKTKCFIKPFFSSVTFKKLVYKTVFHCFLGTTNVSMLQGFQNNFSGER